MNAIMTQIVHKECSICLSNVPTYAMCTLNPCLHDAVCLQCATQMHTETCPLCRTDIQSVTTLRDFKPNGDRVEYPLEDVRQWKEDLDQNIMDNVPVVLFLGGNDSGKTELMDNIKQVYAPVDPTPVDSLRYSEFVPNVELLNGNLPLRLVNCPLPWNPEEGVTTVLKSNAALWTIRIAVICVPLKSEPTHVRNSNLHVMRIQKFLRREFGEHLDVMCVITTGSDPSKYSQKVIEAMETSIDEGIRGQNLVGVFTLKPDRNIARSISSVCNLIINTKVYEAVDNYGGSVFNLITQ